MIYRFADCQLDTDRHRLTRDGGTVAVEPQVFDLLRLLAEAPDRLVTRDEIVEAVWQGRIVSESAISARIAAARKAVGDDGKAQRVIRTVARRGLQMAVPVQTGPPDDAPRGTAPRDPGVQRIRYTRSPRGRTLAYAVTGTGPPLMHFNYMGNDLEREWNDPEERRNFAPICRHHRLLRFDAAGTGQSGPHGLPESDLDTLAEDALAVADAAGFERFAIISQSGGALIALTFAAKYPDRVSRIVVVGGYAEGMDRRTEGDSRILNALFEEAWTNPDSPHALAHLVGYMPEGNMAGMQRRGAILHEATTLEGERVIRKMMFEASLLPILDRIAAPTLIIHCRGDRIHPLIEAQKLAAGIRDAELVVLESANHLPWPDQPVWDDYIDTLLEFLGRDAERSSEAAPG